MLRTVLHTVPRVGRSYEHFPDGFEPHLLPLDDQENLSENARTRPLTPNTVERIPTLGALFPPRRARPIWKIRRACPRMRGRARRRTPSQSDLRNGLDYHGQSTKCTTQNDIY